MPKMATKAADSVWYQARMEASAWNDRLKSREGASEVTGIDRTRLAYIELGTVIPHPDDALMLSDVYNAPELCNHFCSTQCPLGRGKVEPVRMAELEGTTLQLLQTLNALDLETIKTELVDIAADGKIDTEERPRMECILQTLTDAANKIEAMKLLFLKQAGREH